MFRLNDEKTRAQLGCLLLALTVVSCDAEAPRASFPRAQAQAQAPAAPRISLEQTLQMRIADNPSDVDSLTGLANLYYDQNRHVEAIPMYLEALELEPGNIAVRTDLGTCYIATKQYPEARIAYARVMQESPGHLNSTFNMGVLENLEGNYAEAADLWDRAVAMVESPAQAQRLQRMAQDARRRADGRPSGK